jgi:hypothetical protein
MPGENGLTQAQGPALTPEAEKAVRDYLWKCLGPTTVTFVIAAGLLGFIIRDIAMEKSANQAFVLVQDRVLRLVDSAKTSADNAEKAAKEVAKIQVETKARAASVDKDIEAFGKKIEGIEGVVNSFLSDPQLLQKISDSLAADPRVIRAVQEASSVQVSGVQSELARLRAAFQVECKEDEVPQNEGDSKMFSFKFPVKQAWIDGVVGRSLRLKVDKIQKNVVSVLLTTHDGVPADNEDLNVLRGGTVRCRVCATGF